MDKETHCCKCTSCLPSPTKSNLSIYAQRYLYTRSCYCLSFPIHRFSSANEGRASMATVNRTGVPMLVSVEGRQLDLVVKKKKVPHMYASLIHNRTILGCPCRVSETSVEMNGKIETAKAKPLLRFLQKLSWLRDQPEAIIVFSLRPCSPNRKRNK